MMIARTAGVAIAALALMAMPSARAGPSLTYSTAGTFSSGAASSGNNTGSIKFIDAGSPGQYVQLTYAASTPNPRTVMLSPTATVNVGTIYVDDHVNGNNKSAVASGSFNLSINQSTPTPTGTNPLNFLSSIAGTFTKAAGQALTLSFATTSLTSTYGNGGQITYQLLDFQGGVLANGGSLSIAQDTTKTLQLRITDHPPTVTTPEPATLVSASIAGLFGLGAARRKKAKATA